MDIKDRVRAYKKEKRKTVPQIAQIVHISPSTIYHWMCGQRDIPDRVRKSMDSYLSSNGY